MGKFEDDDDFNNDVVISQADGEKLTESLTKIKYQTSKMLCGNTGLSIGTVVDWLEAQAFDGKVRSETCGPLLAYYLKENKPKGKLYLGGDRTVHEAEPVEKPVHTSDKKIGDVFVFPKNNGQVPFGGSAPGNKEISIDIEELEQLAAQGLSLKQIAEEMEIGYSTLQVKIRNFDYVRKAYERGADEFRKIKGMKTAPDSQVTWSPPEIKNHSGCSRCGKPFSGFPAHIPADGKAKCDVCRNADNAKHKLFDVPPKHKRVIAVDEKQLEKLASELATQPEISIALGLAKNTLCNKLGHYANIRAAYERGRKIYLENNMKQKSATVEKKLKSAGAQLAQTDKKHGGARSLITIDLQAMEKAAKENKTQPAIARALGVSVNTLLNKIKKFPELHFAYSRGREARAGGESQTAVKPAVESAVEIIAPEKLAEAKEFCEQVTPTVDEGNVVEEFIEFREKRKEASEAAAVSFPGVLVSSPAVTISMTIQIPLGSRSREFVDRIQNLVAEFQEENQ